MVAATLWLSGGEEFKAALTERWRREPRYKRSMTVNTGTDVIEIFSALLRPVIAFTTTYIAGSAMATGTIQVADSCL